VTPGIGDLEEIVERNGVGMVIRDEALISLRETAAQLKAMAADRAVQQRCREVARERFDLDIAVVRYGRLYRALAHRAFTNPPDEGRPPG
jgi:hypothetical protein